MPKEEKQAKKVKETKEEEPKAVSKEQPSPTKKKIKPKLDKETKELLDKRKERSDKQPDFNRGEWFRYKRLKTKWRRPRAVTNKMRKNLKYRAPKVRVGFGKPSGVRGYHPSGFVEVLVHTVNELEMIDSKLQAARIGSTVGTRKRREIIRAADAKGIRVLNRGFL